MNNTNIIDTEEIQKSNIYILDALQEHDYETKMGKLEYRKYVLLARIQGNELEIENAVPYKGSSTPAAAFLVIFSILFFVIFSPIMLVIFAMSTESLVKSETYFMGLFQYLIFSSIFIIPITILPLASSSVRQKTTSPGSTLHNDYYINEILQIKSDKNELQALEEIIASEKKAVRENE